MDRWRLWRDRFLGGSGGSILDSLCRGRRPRGSLGLGKGGRRCGGWIVSVSLIEERKIQFL